MNNGYCFLRCCSSGATSFVIFLEGGYLISSTQKSVKVCPHDEGSVYQAILVKELEEVKPNEHVKIEASFKNMTDEELKKLDKAYS